MYRSLYGYTSSTNTILAVSLLYIIPNTVYRPLHCCGYGGRMCSKNSSNLNCLKDASAKLYTTNYWFVVLLRRKVEMDRFYPGCCVCGDYSFDKGYLVPTHTFARWRIKRGVPVASILICNNILEFCMDSYFPITYKLGAFYGKASHRHLAAFFPCFFMKTSWMLRTSFDQSNRKKSKWLLSRNFEVHYCS